MGRDQRRQKKPENTGLNTPSADLNAVTVVSRIRQVDLLRFLCRFETVARAFEQWHARDFRANFPQEGR
jgi:hypothetical protein